MISSDLMVRLNVKFQVVEDLTDSLSFTIVNLKGEKITSLLQLYLYTNIII